MKAISRRSGFSLIELLTVIAIIAILAAIIFPVMSNVKKRAQMNQCITNLHQIGVAVQMFKQENRRYPLTLGSQAVDQNGNLVTAPGNQIPFESAKGENSLYAEYVNTIQMFHCPVSRFTNSSEIVSYDPTPNDGNNDVVYVYSYNSYDCFVPALGATTGEIHYCINWADSESDVAQYKPYPPDSTTDTPLLVKEDYKRQLKWRTPPGDTVITWCSYHEDREGYTNPADYRGKTPVLFLDGHTDLMPANEVGQCKWRIRPKKG